MKNRKIKIGLTILFYTLTSSAFAQQYLWSTIDNDSLKNLNRHVPLSEVTEEVLKFYDRYELYYDFTGFTKETFLNSLQGGFTSEQKKKLEGIKELTVLAARTNLGKGSVVYVMCISKNNVNAIVFSNTPLVSGMDYLLTRSSKREKFEKWFKTLLN